MACEGTRFTEAKRQKSLKFAAEKNLTQLKYHLLPRTRGFSLIMKGAKGKSKSKIERGEKNRSTDRLVPAVYNFMLAFTRDSAPPTFRTLLKGDACHAQLYIK